VRDLEQLIEPLSGGDPESALRWTCKSVPPGAKVSKKQIAEINIRADSFHGEWNYTIRPNSGVT
jgi:hypothetical protein